MKGAERPATTKCAANELTAAEITGYVDKKSGLDVGPFAALVNEIIAARHADGTLALR